MDDKTMLELAAKAAGMDEWRYSGHFLGMVKMIDPSRPAETGSMGRPWNPLTHDGDALRLAVWLGIDILPGRGTEAWTRAIGQTTFADEPPSADRLAATRRAIVRAAAEIGKAMGVEE